MENNNIRTLNDLAGFSEDEILRVHGMGKNAVLKLTVALREKGLYFK